MPLHSKDDIRDDALDDIYASSDLGQVMPKYKMPELEHDPRHAFSVVRDELMLDGNSRQNLATFCQTWMDPEIHQLMDICIDKMGNVANASSEIEMRGALGWMVGEEGRGVNAIIEMVAMTRFDCMIGSTAGQRQAVAQAVNHALERSVFGKRLIDQPLMRNVLADLQLEVEGSLAITMRMGEALDRSLAPGGDEHEKRLLRLGLPTGKYWICKRTPCHAYEAMECLGGNGVTEDFILARLYRDAPINAIWEGSGNVQALDMLRALGRNPEVLETWYAELAKTQGASPGLDAAVLSLQKALLDPEEVEYRARRLVDQLALTMQAALLLQAGNQAVADAFIASRLGLAGERNYGTLPRGLDVATILQRANPHDVQAGFHPPGR